MREPKPEKELQAETGPSCPHRSLGMFLARAGVSWELAVPPCDLTLGAAGSAALGLDSPPKGSSLVCGFMGLTPPSLRCQANKVPPAKQGTALLPRSPKASLLLLSLPHYPLALNPSYLQVPPPACRSGRAARTAGTLPAGRVQGRNGASNERGRADAGTHPCSKPTLGGLSGHRCLPGTPGAPLFSQHYSLHSNACARRRHLWLDLGS